MRFLPGLLVPILAMPCASVVAGDLPTGQSPALEDVSQVESVIPPDESFLDRSHAYVDRAIIGVVTWFDGLFGDTAEGDAEKTVDNLRWTNELRAEKGEHLRYRSSLHARLRLPILERRARLVFSGENWEDAATPLPDQPGIPIVSTPTKANATRAIHSELRYYAHETDAGYAFLAAGARFVWPPETFVRARALLRLPLASGTFLVPSVTPFWKEHLGLGLTPQLDFEHLFGRDYIFLWTNSATGFRERPGVLWGTEVSLSRILSPSSALAVAAGAFGSTHPSPVPDRYKMVQHGYRVAVKYRRKIFRPWLFLELASENFWRPHDEAGRAFVPALVMRLEINSAGPRALVPIPKIAGEELPIPALDRH